MVYSMFYELYLFAEVWRDEVLQSMKRIVDVKMKLLSYDMFLKAKRYGLSVDVLDFLLEELDEADNTCINIITGTSTAVDNDLC